MKSYTERFQLSEQELRESINLQYLSPHHPDAVNIDKNFVPKTATHFRVLYNLSKSEAGRKKLLVWDQHMMLQAAADASKALQENKIG